MSVPHFEEGQLRSQRGIRIRGIVHYDEQTIGVSPLVTVSIHRKALIGEAFSQMGKTLLTKGTASAVP